MGVAALSKVLSFGMSRAPFRWPPDRSECLFLKRCRIVGRRRDLEGGSRGAGRRETARHRHQSDEVRQAHRLFRVGVSFIAEALVSQNFVGQDVAGPFAYI